MLFFGSKARTKSVLTNQMLVIGVYVYTYIGKNNEKSNHM